MNEELKLQLFELKQKFLRVIPHPKLILKEMKVLNRMDKSLDLSRFNYELIELKSDNIYLSIELFLENHIQETLNIKQKISAAHSVQTIFENLGELFELQVELLKKMQAYVPLTVELFDKEIKLSEPIDTYAILKRIRELKLKENEIKDYLCREIKAQEKPLDIIVLNCLRANKILSHV